MWVMQSLMCLAVVAFAAGTSDVGIVDFGKKKTSAPPPPPTPPVPPATPFPSQASSNWDAFNDVMKNVWIGFDPKATTMKCGAFQIFDLTADEIVGDKNVTIALVWNKLSFECTSDTNSSLEVAINMTMVWDTVAFPQIGDCQLTECSHKVVSYKAEGIFKSEIVKIFEEKILPILCTTLAKKTNVIGTLMEIIGKILPDTPNKPLPHPEPAIAEKKFAPFYGDLVKLDTGAAQFATRFLMYILNLQLYGMPVIDIVMQKLPSILIPIGDKISLWNIPYLDDLIRLNITLNSFKVNGLDKIAGINLIDIIGDYTIRNSINMTDLSFEISLGMEYGPGKLIEIDDSTSELESVKDTVNVTVALNDAFLMVDLLMAFDRESMMNTAIGGFHQRPMACLFGMLSGVQPHMPVGFDFTFIDLRLSGMTITRKSGNPGWDQVLNTLFKGLGDIWDKPLGRFLRPTLQSTIRPLLNEVLVDLIKMSQESDPCPAPSTYGSTNDMAKSLLTMADEMKVAKELDATNDEAESDHDPIFHIKISGYPATLEIKSLTSSLVDQPKNATVLLNVTARVADTIDYPAHLELSFLKEDDDRLPYNVTTQEDKLGKIDITSEIAPKLKPVADILNGLREEMRLFVQTPSSSDVTTQESAFLSNFKAGDTVIRPLHEIMDDLILMDVMGINEIVSYFLIHGIPKIPDVVTKFSNLGFPIAIKNGFLVITLNDKISLPVPKAIEGYFTEMDLTIKTIMIKLPSISVKDLASLPEFSIKGNFTLETVLRKLNTNFTVDYDLEVSPGPNVTGITNNTVWSDTLSVGLTDATLNVDTRLAFDSSKFDTLSMFAVLFTPVPCMFSPIALNVNFTMPSKSGNTPFKINDIASGLAITSITRTAGKVFVESNTDQPVFGGLSDAVANTLTATLGMTMVEAVANVGLFLAVGAGIAGDLLWDPCFIPQGVAPTARPTYVPGPAPGSAAATIPSVLLLALLVVMLLL